MDATFLQTTATPKTGFWARQFGPDVTPRQNGFDVTFGLVLPILCLMADPMFFKSFPLFGRPLLGEYQLFAYVMSAVVMGFFLAWRTFPAKANGLSPLFGGVFLGGACFSALVGMAMLPVTLWALLFIIGLLGLIPFVTGFVYLRTGVRALKAQAHVSRGSRIKPAVLSGVFVISSLGLATVAVDEAISASVDTLILGNAVEAEAAANRLKWFPFIPLKHYDRLGFAYSTERSAEKRATLGRVYWELTGEDIDQRQRMLAD